MPLDHYASFTFSTQKNCRDDIMSTVYSSYLSTQPGTALGGRTTTKSSSNQHQYPVETVNVMANQVDAVSMITDPRFTASSARKDSKTSSVNKNGWKLTSVPEIDNDDDDDDDDESVQSKISRYSLKKVMQIALITGKTPDEVAAHLLRKENEKKMEKKLEKRRTKKLFADALEVGKNPKEIAMFLMQEEKKRKAQEQAAKVGKTTPKETVKLLVQAAEKGKAQEQAEAERKEQEEVEERTVEKKGGAVAAQVSKVSDSDDETADSTVPSIQDDCPDAVIEVKDESFTAKLISVETSENQEVTLVEDLVEDLVQEHTDDEGTIMSEERTVMSTTVLREMMSDAIKESNNPEDIAAYLFKKDQERKLEKLKIEQEVTAALRAGKSPVEIAKFLTKVEEERLKVEEERRAKKANEYLVTRALKKGKTPGEIAAILLQAKEAQNQPDQELERETWNRTPKDAAVAGGKPCNVEPHVDVVGADNYSSEEKDNEDAASDANVLTEKQVKIEMEIHKLKADLGKAELVQKEIEKLKADLVKAELKIQSLEEGNEHPAVESKTVSFHYNHDDEEDTFSNVSDLCDDLDAVQRAGFFRCFPRRY